MRSALRSVVVRPRSNGRSSAPSGSREDPAVRLGRTLRARDRRARRDGGLQPGVGAGREPADPGGDRGARALAREGRRLGSGPDVRRSAGRRAGSRTGHRDGRDYEMFLPGETVLVSVSGGPDSVCLVESLVRLRRLLGIDLAVFHLDHRLREDSSERRGLRPAARGAARSALRPSRRRFGPVEGGVGRGVGARPAAVGAWPRCAASSVRNASPRDTPSVIRPRPCSSRSCAEGVWRRCRGSRRCSAPRCSPSSRRAATRSRISAAPCGFARAATPRTRTSVCSETRFVCGCSPSSSARRAASWWPRSRVPQSCSGATSTNSGAGPSRRRRKSSRRCRRARGWKRPSCSRSPGRSRPAWCARRCTDPMFSRPRTRSPPSWISPPDAPVAGAIFPKESSPSVTLEYVLLRLPPDPQREEDTE